MGGPSANLNESNETIRTYLETDDKDRQSGSNSDSGNQPDKNASTSSVHLVKNKTYPEHMNPFTSNYDENLSAEADLSSKDDKGETEVDSDAPDASGLANKQNGLISTNPAMNASRCVSQSSM